jgi:hypothetical protein
MLSRIVLWQALPKEGIVGLPDGAAVSQAGFLEGRQCQRLA